MKKVPMSAIFKHYELEKNTIDFIGHAVALYFNDEFLQRPAIDCL
jgi:Rab GDP dissociation inhibitor